MQPAVIGLDIGTTSVSVVAITDSGTQIAAATRPHNALVAGLPKGYFEQSPRILWDTAAHVLREVTASLPNHQVVAVGVTGQMHSTILLDGNGIPVSNVITWRDKRALHLRPDGRTILDAIVENVSHNTMYGTGCNLFAGISGVTVAAMKELNEWPDNCQQLAFVADWIAAQLTGSTVVTDRTHAASSGLYDLQHDQWNEELLLATDTSANLLPEVRDSGVGIGPVSADAANLTGLSQQTMVCNAIGDHQAATISTLPKQNDCVLINIGTGGQIAWRVPKFVRLPNMETRYLPGMVGDESHNFILAGVGACGGHSYAWINQTIRNWLAAFGIERTETEIWQRLGDILKTSPQTATVNEGLSCEPFFSGTRDAPFLRGSFHGVTMNNFTPANVAQSILVGIADTMYTFYESATGNRPNKISTIALAGNCVRENPLLVKAIEQKFGVPALVSQCREEAATGAAMMASRLLN